MVRKLYHKLYRMYYLTVFLLTTGIVLSVALYQASAARSHRLSLSQAYVHNVILQLQNDTILSDAAYKQYDSYAPMDLFLIRGDTVTPFVSETIRTPCHVLESILREQLQSSFEFQDAGGTGTAETPSHPLTFHAAGTCGEVFRCTHVRLRSARGREYELYAASLINKGLFSPRQIVQLGGLELLLLLSFRILGKRMIRASIAPVNENMRQQKEFTAAASHELKTPLSKIVIANNSDGITNRQAVINRECERMDRIIKNLLFIASSESCTWNTQFEPVDPVNLCVLFYEISTPLLTKNGRELQLDLPEEPLAPILADRALLLQLLTILLDNAIAHSGENSPVSLKLLQGKKYLSLVLIDHGVGIPDAYKQKIFSGFYKIHASTPDHSGLGLRIAKTIVELHRGKITVSDTPGGGATFTVLLPSG